MSAKKLTPKQIAFVERYNVHGNGVRAAKEAGYKGNDNTLNQVARDNLQKPIIAEKIKKVQEKKTTANNIDAQWVIDKYVECIGSFTTESGLNGALNGLAKVLGLQTQNHNLNGSVNVHSDIMAAIKKVKEENKK